MWWHTPVMFAFGKLRQDAVSPGWLQLCRETLSQNKNKGSAIKVCTPKPYIKIKPNKPLSPRKPQTNEYRVQWASDFSPYSCEVMSTCSGSALPPALHSFPLIPCSSSLGVSQRYFVYMQVLMHSFFFLLKHWFLFMFNYFHFLNFFFGLVWS